MNFSEFSNIFDKGASSSTMPQFLGSSVVESRLVGINQLVMYYCYLIENQTGQIYIGQTSDIGKRILAHNTNAHRWTSNKGPWKMIHSEAFNTRSDAMFREKQLKSMKAGQRIKELLHIPSLL